jgi:glycosyltransferase involved in cell wall biosynthesis
MSDGLSVRTLTECRKQQRSYDDRICVVQIIDRLVIGGPTKHTISLAADLSPERFKGELIAGRAASGEYDITVSAYEAGLRPIVIGELSREISIKDVAAFLKIFMALWRLRPDIVHTHKSKAGVLGRIAAAVYRWSTPSALLLKPRVCKTVHTFHGHVFDGYFAPRKAWLFVRIETFLARFCTDVIVTVSKQQRNEICNKYRVADEDKVRVVPLGVDIGREPAPRGTVRQEYGIADEDIVIGAVGRLCEIKNFELLLRAFAKMLRRSDSCEVGRSKLVIVGDGHLRGSLVAVAAALGIADAVVFTGIRRDVDKLYPDFDVVTLSSLNEGTPTALIEGMLYGRPTVATEVGGVGDIMGRLIHRQKDGCKLWEHGITAPSGDEDALAQALQILASDKTLRQHIGSVAKTFALKNFAKEALLKNMQGLYEELMDTKPRRQEGAWLRKRSAGLEAVTAATEKSD